MNKVFTTCYFITLTLITIKSYSQDCDLNATDKRRTQVTYMKPPYSYISQMTMKRGDSYFGTAFFIHPRVLLTAGHNLRKRPQIIFTRVKQLTLQIGATDKTTNLYYTNFETTQDENIFTNHEFNRDYTIFEDFGLIILPDSIAYQKVGGYFKLAVFDSAKIKGKYIHMSGYPSDRPFCTQWQDSTQNFFFYNGYMHYDFGAEHGASGSPVWYNESSNNYVFAIHTNGDGFDQFKCNTATLITQELFNEIKEICLSRGIDITQ